MYQQVWSFVNFKLVEILMVRNFKNGRASPKSTTEICTVLHRLWRVGVCDVGRGVLLVSWLTRYLVHLNTSVAAKYVRGRNVNMTNEGSM